MRLDGSALYSPCLHGFSAAPIVQNGAEWGELDTKFPAWIFVNVRHFCVCSLMYWWPGSIFLLFFSSQCHYVLFWHPWSTFKKKPTAIVVRVYFMSSASSSVIRYFFCEGSVVPDCRKHFFSPVWISRREWMHCREKQKKLASPVYQHVSTTEIKSPIFPQHCGRCRTFAFTSQHPNSSFSQHLCFSEPRDRWQKQNFPSQCKCVKKHSKTDLSLLCRFTWSVSLLPCWGLSLFFVCVHARTSIIVFVWFDCAQVCVGMRALQCQSVAFLLCSLFHCFCSTIFCFVGSFLQFLNPT